MARFRQWVVRRQEAAPKAVSCLREDLEELLPFLDMRRRRQEYGAVQGAAAGLAALYLLLRCQASL